MADSGVKPLFLFSLPRSGSTLLQRLLGAHPGVSTVGEPWILLPYLYTRRRSGSMAEWGYSTMVEEVDQLCAELPEGEADYVEAIRDLALTLYAKLADAEATYFLDKTPRYHFVVDEILAMFPDARFIFLWRNPLAVAASILESFGGNKWNLQYYAGDLMGGLDRLVRAAEREGARCLALRYEDLVVEPEKTLEAAFGYLDLEPDLGVLERFKQIHPWGGDTGGSLRYAGLSQDSLDRWPPVLASPLRRNWCRRYLRWIGQQRLSAMGYDGAALREELDSAPTTWGKLPSDSMRALVGGTQTRFRGRMLGGRSPMWPPSRDRA